MRWSVLRASCLPPLLLLLVACPNPPEDDDSTSPAQESPGPATSTTPGHTEPPMGATSTPEITAPPGATPTLEPGVPATPTSPGGASPTPPAATPTPHGGASPTPPAATPTSIPDKATATPEPSPTPTLAPTATPQVDQDGDGFFAADDCDDSDPVSYPGADETCDAADNDCDGETDEGLPLADYYLDTDGDGYGAGDPVSSCRDLDGHATISGDCADGDPNAYPGADEVPYDGIDQDCDGIDLTDVDGDGHSGAVGGTDCDDLDPTIYQGATEIPYDGIDQDCDYADLTDVDGDGYDGGDGGTDCDDAEAGTNPGATEIPYDGIDQDCDGIDLTDVDGDGYDGGDGGTDCDDEDPDVHPGAQEVCDGIDQDCDGVRDEEVTSTYYVDADGDGFGVPADPIEACEQPEGYAENSADCDDSDPEIRPDTNGQCPLGSSCSSILAAGRGSGDGVYLVDPDGLDSGFDPFEVYCDMTTDGGGWIVFQRRVDGSIDFYRGWSDYLAGFGSLEGEFWLGNEKIHLLTSTVASTLRVDMTRYTGDVYYATYGIFSVDAASNDYMLHVDQYAGTAPDCVDLSGMGEHNGMGFTTFDRDNDQWSGNCAQAYKGGWWYGSCHYNNLNGIYYGGPHSSYADGIDWYCVTGYYEALTFVEMKMR